VKKTNEDKKMIYSVFGNRKTTVYLSFSCFPHKVCLRPRQPIFYHSPFYHTVSIPCPFQNSGRKYRVYIFLLSFVFFTFNLDGFHVRSLYLLSFVFFTFNLDGYHQSPRQIPCRRHSQFPCNKWRWHLSLAVANVLNNQQHASQHRDKSTRHG